MGVDAPQILADNWHYFVDNGATQTCTYKKMGDTTYTPGNAVSKPVVSSHTIEIVWDRRIKRDFGVGSTIRSIEEIAIFPAVLLPVIPEINDLIVDSNSKEWEVLVVEADPVDAHYELLVQAVS